MSIYKVERNPINESIDEEEMEFVGIVEVVFDKYGELKEFRTGGDILHPITENVHGGKDIYIKYIKNQKVKLNIIPTAGLGHGSRVKIKQGRRTLGTRALNFNVDENGDTSVAISIYTSQKKKKSELEDDKDLTKDQLNAALSFITDQAETLRKFVDGECGGDEVDKAIDVYNAKPDRDKEALAKEAEIVK